MKTDSSESKDTKSLVAKVLGGDHQAYAELVNSCKGEVFAMIMRQVGDEAIAEELSQETFLKAYRGLSRFNHRARFSTWVIRIALNESSSYFKSKRFKQRTLTESLDGHEVIATDTGNNKEYRSALLRSALGCLKPKYRDVVTLHCLQSLSYTEIASTLEIPMGTVASRMNQAMKLLRKEIMRLQQ